MPFNEMYQRQVALLIKILPHVAAEDCFALKGGTAINLFVRNMPRLSVDIDLTYLPVSSRKESLAAIDAAMKRILHRIQEALRGAQISASTAMPENAVTKLLVRHDSAQVKIGNTRRLVRGSLRRKDRRSTRPPTSPRFLRRAGSSCRRGHQRRVAARLYRLPLKP
jgi:hypothetical protein